MLVLVLIYYGIGISIGIGYLLVSLSVLSSAADYNFNPIIDASFKGFGIFQFKFNWIYHVQRFGFGILWLLAHWGIPLLSVACSLAWYPANRRSNSLIHYTPLFIQLQIIIFGMIITSPLFINLLEIIFSRISITNKPSVNSTAKLLKRWFFFV